MNAPVAHDLRQARLQSLLRDVAGRSKFYRHFYARHGITVDERFLERLGRRFDELPILETHHLLNDADDLRLEGEQHFRVTCSGGTLNAPKVLYRTEGDWAASVQNMAEVFGMAGVRRGDVLMIAQPLDIWGVGYLALDCCKRLRCLAVPVGMNKDPEMMSRFVERFGVNVVFGSPSLLKGFTQWAEMNVTRRDIRLLVAGEKLYAADREYLSDFWGNGVYNLYGSEETDALAAECDAHDGMHILGHSFLFELMSDGNYLALKNDATTEGELIITSCYHRGSPIIKYRLGDIAAIKTSERPCVCGRRSPRITVMGKINQCVTLYDATKLYTYQVDAALEQVIGRGIQYQLLVEDVRDGHVKERVTLLVARDDMANVERRRIIEALARSSLDLADAVTSRQVELRADFLHPEAETTSKGKWLKIVDRRSCPRS